MKSYSFRLVLLLSFLLIVGGVNAQDEATEEPAPFVESPTVAPSATLEPTATLMPTNTPTLAPTATLVPTLTPTIEPTAT
ncbi:MAG: endoglucanase, partial [Anaerolineae bacterium]|nr:endoglucanase [Anaerolineae bacterium]